MQRRSILRNAGTAAVAALAAPWVRALSWPEGPVRIIVGFPPGGGTDALARILSQKLTPVWGQQVVVENKAGAAGVLAAEYVAKQPSDGSTLLLGHINSHGIAPALRPNLSYKVDRDFVPIVLLGVTPNLLIANPSVQAKTVKDIVAQGRKTPGQLSFGSAGAGSAQHLALEMFKARAKVDLLHVPYRGSAPLLQDLIGGQIQYSFDTMTAATPTREERAGDCHRADPHQARQGSPGRAHRGGAGLPRLRRHHLVWPAGPRQAAHAHRQEHQRGSEQDPRHA